METCLARDAFVFPMAIEDVFPPFMLKITGVQQSHLLLKRMYRFPKSIVSLVSLSVNIATPRERSAWSIS